MINIVRTYAVVLTIFTNIKLFFVSREGLSHIKSVLEVAFSCRVVAIICNHASIDTISGSPLRHY